MRLRVTRLALCLAELGFAAAKKPVTLEALTSAKPPAAPEAPVWSGDGARFVYTESGKLWLYDMASRSRQTLAALAALEATAVRGESPGRFEFENRRVREQPIQWTRSGGELLLSAGGDLSLYRFAAGGWTQLTATPERERDPKLSPDGRAVSFFDRRLGPLPHARGMDPDREEPRPQGSDALGRWAGRSMGPFFAVRRNALQLKIGAGPTAVAPWWEDVCASSC